MTKRHTDDDLLRLYHELKEQIGRHQLRRLRPVSDATYRNRFGGMRELRERYEGWAEAKQA